jgi:hypothetical protein
MMETIARLTDPRIAAAVLAGVGRGPFPDGSTLKYLRLRLEAGGPVEEVRVVRVIP